MAHQQAAQELTRSLRLDTTHEWTTSTINNIDALSVAYAYCDAILVTGPTSSTVSQTHAACNFDVFVAQTHDELTTWIDALPVSAPTDPRH